MHWEVSRMGKYKNTLKPETDEKNVFPLKELTFN